MKKYLGNNTPDKFSVVGVHDHWDLQRILLVLDRNEGNNKKLNFGFSPLEDFIDLVRVQLYSR